MVLGSPILWRTLRDEEVVLRDDPEWHESMMMTLRVAGERFISRAKTL